MRLFILVIAFFTMSFTTQASNTNKLSNALKKCVQIDDSQHRLTCYDNLSNSSAVISSKKIAKKKVIVTKKAKVLVEKVPSQPEKKSIEITTKTINENNFGKEHLKKDPKKEITKVNLIVAKVTKNAFKQLSIVFQNGQIWQQKDDIRLRLKTGDQVELTKGVFSVVYLKKINTSKRIKVKRIK